MTIQVSRNDFRREIIPDLYSDTSYLEQEGFEDRLRKCNNNELGFVGVRAFVEIDIPIGNDGTTIRHKIASPGFWGIGDDSDEVYFDDIFQDACDILEDMLLELSKIEIKPTPLG